MASRSATWVALTVIALSASVASAVPISVTIDDYDFSFDTDFVVNYIFNGALPDVLVTTPDTSEVVSYRYLGTEGPTDLAGYPTGLYPVWASAAPMVFGGDLELEMVFNAADGPYTGPGGDQMDISLTGTPDVQTPSVGFLRVTGIIGTPMPPMGGPLTLLEIQFDATSLLGRADVDVIDLVEGVGKVTQLLGMDVSAEGRTGVVAFKFSAEASGSAIFPTPPGQNYDPQQDHGLSDVPGRVDGQAGIPEPAGLVVLLFGAVALISRRRRRW